MTENVPPSIQPVNAQAMDTEQVTTNESQNRGSANAGMFSDLTVDV